MATQPTAAAKPPAQDAKAVQRGKLIAKLGPDFARAPDTLSAAELWKLASAYRKSGQAETALRVCEAGLELHPDSADLRALQGDTLFGLGRRPEALTAYEALFARHETAIPNACLNRYQHLLKPLSPEMARASRLRASGPISRQAERAFARLEQGRPTEAAAQFARALAMLFPDPGPRADWTAAFAELARLVCGSEAAPEDPGPGPALPPVLVASGMGWSGSGAIFDYFAEFDDALARTGEFPLIEGRFGLAELAHARGLPKIRRQALGLFRYHFFGFATMPGGSPAKSLRFAKRAFVQADPIGGAALARASFALLRRNLRGERIAADGLRDILARYMFFQSQIVPGELGSRRLLFDNIVHAYNLAALEFTRGITVFVCLRDPRSNYVSRLNEDTKPLGPVGQFIDKYRAMRARIDQDLAQLGHLVDTASGPGADPGPSGVRLVQFEPFVLSRDYRLDLARAAGLDPARQREYTRFQPEVSRKNVFNFRTHPDQEAIRRIEAELGEYCLDLDRLTAEGSRPPPDRAME